MDQLLWMLIREELQSQQRPMRPGPSDLAARAVLGDALAESGNLRLAQALLRWPADKGLWGTPLLRKLEAAVRGPAARGSRVGVPRPKKILLAFIRRQGADPVWVSIDRNVGGPHYGKPYVIEMGCGYSSYYGLVWAGSVEDALEAAEEAFPHHFYDEVDEDEVEDHHHVVMAHPTKPGVVLVEDESAFSQTAVNRARRVVSGRRLDEYGRQARLRTGEIVEFIT